MSNTEQHDAGEPVAYLDLEKVQQGMAYATRMKVNHRQVPLYTHPAPAVQNGEPVALPAYRDSDLRSPMHGHSRGWNACLDEIAKLGPLYTHADPGGAEQLRATVKKALAELEDRKNEIYALRAQLAEQDAHPIRVLGQEAYSTLVGMVEFCLNKRVCLGMDEGYENYLEEEGEHDFVKELRSFVALSARAEPKCCSPTTEEQTLLADGDFRPEELWGGARPTCNKDCK